MIFHGWCVDLRSFCMHKVCYRFLLGAGLCSRLSIFRAGLVHFSVKSEAYGDGFTRLLPVASCLW